jgi:phosphoglycerol transferase MdoB-like AlkP superfamily enzyme
MNKYLREIKFIALQFLFLLGCYFISRSVFTLIHLQYFPNLTLSEFLKIEVAALRFDIAAIIAVNSLYLIILFWPTPIFQSTLGSRFLQSIFIISNATAFLFEISDWAYFPYNQKRATADLLDLLTRKGDFMNQLPSLLSTYWFVPLSGVALISALVLANKKITGHFYQTNTRQGSFIGHSIRFVLIVSISIIGFRGGMQYVPIGIRNAIEATKNEYVPIVLNTPFSIISTLTNEKLEEEIYFDETSLKKLINTTKYYPKGVFDQKNVVVLILESYSKEFTGIGGLKSYTPFLDSLMNHAFVCNNAFANGYRSAEGIPAIISGIPSIQEEPFTTSPYGANRITTIPNLLSAKGYSSTFYHGGSNGTMSFDLFAKNAGYDRYIGRDEYPNDVDYDGVWGIWDEPFLQFCNKDISKNLKEPFVASIFTISSHPPYKVPSKYRTSLPKGTLPIHQPIAYTDLALRRFFESSQTQKWFQNTLFVIVADHCSPLSEDDYYHYKQGRFAIPIVYFSPSDSSLKGNTNELTQQIDILPSVMDYLGYNDSFFAFGNSIFSKVKNRFTIQQWSGSQLWTLNNRFVRCNYKNPEGLFDVQNDKLCNQNLLHQNDSFEKQTLQYLKAFRQVYSNAMINNKLWVK